MEQFSLDKWLQDKSRKVVTRDGRPVRIICTDAPITQHPIVGLVECDLFTWTDDGEVIYGGKWENKNDLFFADEEYESTEFEKSVSEFIQKLTFNGNVLPSKDIKGYAKSLLDLARKEILKDFPKWKKDNNNLSSLTYRLDNRGNGDILLCRKGYAININELLNLPKEE